MSRILEPGSHDGKIVDYGISKTSKGNKQVFVIFDVDGKTITWYGGLNAVPSGEGKRAQLDFTVKTLLDLGFTGEAVETLAAGKDSNGLEVGKEMTLIIEDNVYEGETQSRVKYINEKGFIPGPARMTFDEVAGGSDTGAFRAELMRQRKMKSTGKEAPKSPI